LHLDPDVGVVRADQGQMEQLLINLATNARDAMPAGGRVHVRTANCNIADVSSAPPHILAGDYVSLSVTDEGEGMSADIRSRVFEPFFTTKPQDRGLGLGLSMVHDIVTESGGFITVDSESGRGSTFTVLLSRLATGTMTAPAEAAVAGGTPSRQIRAHR
ncbi:MAG: ATP-binding protein, partial [Acidobacteria bacterium]|nr:ATP-binding protein [Acidobacteriota bacterium]